MLKELIANPSMPELGERYMGTVVKTTNFGAFVSLSPGKDGLLHISEIADRRIGKVEDVLKLGDEVDVKVLGIDDRGKIKLSRKAALAEKDAAAKAYLLDRFGPWHAVPIKYKGRDAGTVDLLLLRQDQRVRHRRARGELLRRGEDGRGVQRVPEGRQGAGAEEPRRSSSLPAGERACPSSAFLWLAGSFIH